MRMWPRGLIGASNGWTMVCPCFSLATAPGFRPVLPVTVIASPCSRPRSSRYFISPGPADAVQIFLDVLAARLQVGKQRNPVAHPLEVRELERHARRARDRQQVQHGVGRAADRHHHHHRVLERLRRQDVERLDVALEQQANGSRSAPALPGFAWIIGGGGRTVGQR